MSKKKRDWGKGRDRVIAFRVTTEVYEVLQSINKSPSLAAREIVEQFKEKEEDVQNTRRGSTQG